MANLPESLFGSEAPSSSSAGGVGASTSRTNTSSTLHGGDSSKLYLEQLIIALQDDHTREHALDLLYKVFPFSFVYFLEFMFLIAC
jgi:hypothetical protein